MFRRVVTQLDGPLSIVVSSLDFDGAASAMGLASIVQRLGGDPRIYYCGPFSMRQGRWLKDRYFIQRWLRPMKEFIPRGDGQDNFALVDSSNVDDKRLGIWSGKLDPAIVVDNHNGFNVPYRTLKWVYIDDGVCAVSTLVFELMERLGLGLDKLPRSEQLLLSLMLAMGIYTDSYGMRGARERDCNAYEKLGHYLKMDELKHLAEYPLPKQFDEYYSNACETHLAENGWVVASAGIIRPEDPHEVSEVADQLSEKYHGQVVIVFGIYEDEDGRHMKISARQQGCTDINEFVANLQAVFGEGSDGRYRGKHEAIGGASLDLNGNYPDLLKFPQQTYIRRVTGKWNAVSRGQ